MEGGDGKDFERDYYLDCYRAAGKLCAGDGRTSVYIPDEQIWFERVMKYYRNMTARSYQNWLLDMNCAADLLIAASLLHDEDRHAQPVNFIELLRRELGKVLDEQLHALSLSG